MTHDTDVIVVGAGLAGLVAATEIADAGKRGRHVPRREGTNSRPTLEKGTTEFTEVVAIRGRQADAGNDNTVKIARSGRHSVKAQQRRNYRARRSP